MTRYRSVTLTIVGVALFAAAAVAWYSPPWKAARARADRRLLLKIDVEGAEWDSLLATPDSVLDRLEQMPMEMHGVDERRFLDLVRRLKSKFHVVNLHFNNHGCSAEFEPMPSRAYQVLWVNKRVGVLDPDAPVPAPPSPLNAPDNSDLPDCQIPR